MKHLQITLVELPATDGGKLFGKISDDVYSLVKLPSRATDLLAAIAKKSGYEDVVTINPSYNKIEGLLTMEQLKRIVTSDIVGISSITRTAPQSYELCKYIKKNNPKITIIIGGPHASALPEEAIKYADVVILNEGDHTFVDLLNHLKTKPPFIKGGLGGLQEGLNDVAGIVYKTKDGEIKRNLKREFLTNEELSALPFPVYPDDVIKGITHAVINTSRGCPYACEYCAVIENFGQKFRHLSVERTVELIEHTLNQTPKRIFFGDDNFTAIPKRTHHLMEEILRRNIKMPSWVAQVRVESAKDRSLLRLMKRAGCERVCIGFESVNEAALKALNKGATLEKSTAAIRGFHEAKISIHGMFILGTGEDTCETIHQTAEYAKKNRIDTVQFMYMVPLPGTKLTKKLDEAGKILSKQWHRYDGHSILVRPEKMSATELYNAAGKALLSFYSFKEGVKHLFCGNEHWFNFLVRIWGRKIVKKVLDDNLYYQRALTSIENWHTNVIKEFDTWSKRVDDYVKNAKSSADEKREVIMAEWNKLRQNISQKFDSADELFAPYKEKIITELEKMWLEKWNLVYQPTTY